tara:strand:- start:289 stop:645 length:357 start_codon:yes stop_codon:yes gene_type:complete
MGINSTEVAYGFGQLGSAYTTSSADAIIPPTGKVFVAITVLSAAKFDADGFECETPTKFINGSTTIANDLAAGSETTDGGSGGVRVPATQEFPKGATIYGRWTELDLAAGAIIAYIGE